MQITVLTNDKLDAAKRLGRGYTQPERKAINWNDRSDRKWLDSHLHWAMNNGKAVELVPA
jgi:hypothetical protein